MQTEVFPVNVCNGPALLCHSLRSLRRISLRKTCLLPNHHLPCTRKVRQRTAKCVAQSRDVSTSAPAAEFQALEGKAVIRAKNGESLPVLSLWRVCRQLVFMLTALLWEDQLCFTDFVLPQLTLSSCSGPPHHAPC